MLIPLEGCTCRAHSTRGGACVVLIPLEGVHVSCSFHQRGARVVLIPLEGCMCHAHSTRGGACVVLIPLEGVHVSCSFH